MYKELESVYQKVFKPIILSVRDSWFKSSLFLIAIYLFVFPLLEYLKWNVTNYNYKRLLTLVVEFFAKNFSVPDYILTFTVLIIGTYAIYLSKQLEKTKVVREKFEHNLNRWSLPANAGWTIQDSNDKPGRMLKVSSSSEPGTLKEIYSWFDYSVNFMFKFDEGKLRSQKNRLELLVRTESIKNGIVLKFSKEKFTPYILHDGTYIKDIDAEVKLPTILESNQWYNLNIKVEGDRIDIKIADFQLQQYRIQTRTFEVETSVLDKVSYPTATETTLKDIIASDKIINNAFDKWYRLYTQIKSTEDESKKLAITQKSNDAWDEYQNIKKASITFEHQKGSIGFKTTERSAYYIKDLIVKKL